MGDDADLRRVEPDLVAQPGGAVLGVGDDGVHRTEDTAGGADLSALRSRRQDVVRGHHPRPPRRQQPDVERRDRQPLVMEDVGIGGAPEAQHVRQVLGGLEGQADGSV